VAKKKLESGSGLRKSPREKVSFEKKRFFPGEKLGKTCYINALNEQTINKEE
jgi:hypothetical protein